MRKFRFFLASVLFVFIPLLWAVAQNAQQVVPIDSDAYTYLEVLYRETGLSTPSVFKPYTVAEFREYLSLVNPNRLSPEGRRIHSLLRQLLEPEVLLQETDRTGGSRTRAAFSTDATVSVEYYDKTNDEGGFFFTRGDRKPMLEFPLELWLFDVFYANATFALQEDYRLSASRWEPVTFTRGADDPTRIGENHWNLFSAETNVLELDWYFPFRGLMSVGGSHWHLTYGRDSISLGNGQSGNLLLSDFPDFYDTLILTTNWDAFKYTASYTYLEPWLTDSDEDAIESGEYYMRIRDYGLPYKALMLHHLELKPLLQFDRLPGLTLFLSEAIMFGSQYAQLRDFNPFMIFHNWFEYERTNDSFLVGVNLAPFRYVELAYQFFLNEFDTAYEGGNNFPGAAGWMTSIAATVPLQKGIVSGYVEVVHTDPLLYNRYHPLIAFTSRRRIWSYIEQDQMTYVDKSIGYFTGPDTFLVTASGTYSLPPLLSANLEYFYIEKGEKDIWSEYSETPGETTPTGIPEISHVVALHLNVEPVPVLSVGGSVYYVHDINADHVQDAVRDDIQFAIDMTLHIGKETISGTSNLFR